MSETQPFTLWSELAFLTLGHRKTGTRGRSVEILSYGALMMRKSGCYKRRQQHESSPEETKDSDVKEGHQKRCVGWQARRNAPAKSGSQSALGQAQLSLRFCQEAFPLPPAPHTLPSTCPFLAWPGVEGWGTGGGQQSVRASR